VSCAACDDNSPPSNPNTPTNPYTITISTSGIVSPKQLTVPPGTRVLFVNNHSRPHNMTSDPHPDHLDCPDLNQVGLLNAGQSRESGNLVTVRTCGFHDHDDPDNINLRGSIVIRQ
jgi:plastocyanin